MILVKSVTKTIMLNITTLLRIISITKPPLMGTSCASVGAKSTPNVAINVSNIIYYCKKMKKQIILMTHTLRLQRQNDSDLKDKLETQSIIFKIRRIAQLLSDSKDNEDNINQLHDALSKLKTAPDPECQMTQKLGLTSSEEEEEDSTDTDTDTDEVRENAKTNSNMMLNVIFALLAFWFTIVFSCFLVAVTTDYFCQPNNNPLQFLTYDNFFVPYDYNLKGVSDI